MSKAQIIRVDELVRAGKARSRSEVVRLALEEYLLMDAGDAVIVRGRAARGLLRVASDLGITPEVAVFIGTYITAAHADNPKRLKEALDAMANMLKTISEVGASGANSGGGRSGGGAGDTIPRTVPRPRGSRGDP